MNYCILADLDFLVVLEWIYVVNYDYPVMIMVTRYVNSGTDRRTKSFTYTADILVNTLCLQHAKYAKQKESKFKID